MAKTVTGKSVNLVFPACKFWQIVSQQNANYFLLLGNSLFEVTKAALQLIIDFGSDLTWRQIDVRFQVRLSRKKIFI